MEHDTKHTKLGGLQLRSILQSNRAGELLVIREARFSDRTLVFRFLKNFCIKKHRQLSDPSTGLNKPRFQIYLLDRGQQSTARGLDPARRGIFRLLFFVNFLRIPLKIS